MDVFEERLRQIAAMSLTEKQAFMTDLKKRCTCGHCVSYTDCATTRRELLFCFEGKSRTCISVDKGCCCKTCPITKEFGFTHHDFCFKGSEAEMRTR